MLHHIKLIISHRKIYTRTLSSVPTEPERRASKCIATRHIASLLQHPTEPSYALELFSLFFLFLFLFFSFFIYLFLFRSFPPPFTSLPPPLPCRRRASSANRWITKTDERTSLVIGMRSTGLGGTAQVHGSALVLLIRQPPSGTSALRKYQRL